MPPYRVWSRCDVERIPRSISACIADGKTPRETLSAKHLGFLLENSGGRGGGRRFSMVNLLSREISVSKCSNRRQFVVRGSSSLPAY